MEYHNPVMLYEAVDGLNIKSEWFLIYATFGVGGHSKEILKRLDKGKLIAFDKDKAALKNKLNNQLFELVNSDFRHMASAVSELLSHPADGILADLGVSSHQFDSADRGFSTRFQSSLDMRMDGESDLTAREILSTYTEKQLARIFKEYGELRNARRLAREIVLKRKTQSVTSVDGLKQSIGHCAPRGKESQFFAKVFQGLRIEVNDELGALKELLLQSAELIRKGGRLVVITYHSLEDRLVKNFINKGNLSGIIETDLYGNTNTPFKPLHKKPIVPSSEEIAMNNRSRSAKLRIAEKQ